MSNAPLRVGVVGVGVGRAHIVGYKLLPTVELTALCDLDEARMIELAEEFDISECYTDYRDLFANDNVDAVSICLPNNLHAPVSLAALKAGLHVLCEKPLAQNATVAQSIAEAAAKAPTKFMMCYNRRYRPDIQWIKQALNANLIGRVYQVKAAWVRETGIPAGWFTRKEVSGGGPLIDLGVHMLDAALWLLDYPAPLTVSGDVQANFGPRNRKVWQWRGRNQPGDYQVEDSATAFIRLAGGASLYLETSWASHGRPGMDDIALTINGTEGTIDLYIANYATENTLTLYTEINGTPAVTRPTIPTDGRRADHHHAVAAFVNCIRNDTPPPATAEQGLTTMRIIDAIYQSAADRQEIRLEA